MRLAQTVERYQAILAAFRLCPGGAKQVAASLGADTRTIARIWENGWPGLDWARPIRDVIAEEQELARLRAAKVEKSVRAEQVRLATEQWSQSSRAVTAAAIDERTEAELERSAAIDDRAADILSLRRQSHLVDEITASLAELATAAKKLAVRVAEQVDDPTIKPAQALKLLTQIAQATKWASEAHSNVVASRRLIAGLPTSIIETQGGLGGLTFETMIARLVEAGGRGYATEAAAQLAAAHGIDVTPVPIRALEDGTITDAELLDVTPTSTTEEDPPDAPDTE